MVAAADLLEAEGRLLRQRSLETLALALGLILAAGMVGLGGVAALAAVYLWLAELIGRTGALALLGVVAVTFGGLIAWAILDRVRPPMNH